MGWGSQGRLEGGAARARGSEPACPKIFRLRPAAAPPAPARARAQPTLSPSLRPSHPPACLDLPRPPSCSLNLPASLVERSSLLRSSSYPSLLTPRRRPCLASHVLAPAVALALAAASARPGHARAPQRLSAGEGGRGRAVPQAVGAARQGGGGGRRPAHDERRRVPRTSRTALRRSSTASADLAADAPCPFPTPCSTGMASAEPCRRSLARTLACRSSGASARRTSGQIPVRVHCARVRRSPTPGPTRPASAMSSLRRPD